MVYMSKMVTIYNNNSNEINCLEEYLRNELSNDLNEYIQFLGSGNKVIIEGKATVKSKVVFLGDNNILVLSDGTKIEGAHIKFQGSNSLIYLNPARPHPYKGASLITSSGCCIYFGKKANINPVERNRFLALEHANIIIGEDTLFSNDIVIRTNDGHIIYDLETRKRTNFPASVWIGDHVWIARSVAVNKGAIIGSGSVIGGKSLLSKKKYPSNSIIAGVPAKVIKKGIIMDKTLGNHFTQADIDNHMSYEGDEFIYNKDKYTLNIEEIDNMLLMENDAEGKLRIIKKYIDDNNAKNRFAIE